MYFFLKFSSQYESLDVEQDLEVPEASENDESSEGEEQELAQRPRAGRGRARGRGRGRGRPRGRGRGRNRVAPQANNQAQQAANDYDTPDTPNQLPTFSPNRQSGVHLEGPIRRGSMSKAIDFFKLFFTMELMREICEHTNAYAWASISNKPSYGDRHGAWIETTTEELYKLIALIMYCGLVDVSSFQRYWSTKTLYHGLWARSIMSRLRFKALMSMIHVVHPGTEAENDKLRKVSSFLDHFKSKCQELYQPFQRVSIDERMVKSKHRSGIRQYIKNKPTKWGIKLWVLADSANGYTCDFDVYIGKKAGHEPSANGLGYDVVFRLMQPLLNQGYHLYFDNFYTSVKLIKDLFAVGVPATGTAAENRKGFPDCMKKGKEWAKREQRGNMRWQRDGVCLAQQWKDNKPVTILSSIADANEWVMVERKEKENNRWQTIRVKQPKVIENYNQYMNGVDRSDQLLAKNNAIRKCMRWWKILLFHMVDIAVVNSYILFQIHRAEYPENELLKRPQRYSLAEFREELVRQLAGLEEFGNPPVSAPPKRQPGEFETIHLPEFTKTKRNCKVCYTLHKKELKVLSRCSAPQCQVYLHCTADKNCFSTWHSKEYHK